MPIDGQKLAQDLWNATVTGITWMFTVKYPDSPEFAVWILSWLLILLPTVFVSPRIIRRIKNSLFD